jgi:Fe-S-cluster containining protein
VLDIAELNKPAHTWCQHCRPGKGGCSIYADRPPVCHGFACMWLLDASWPEHWFPQRAW